MKYAAIRRAIKHERVGSPFYPGMVPAGNCHLAPRALRRRDRNWRSKTGAEVFSFVAMIYRRTGFRHLRPKRVRVHLCTVEVLSYGR
ncbi:hypothetical protein CDAR_587481 [Caerostris darwini]|uniref:Ribosomal protein L16 n=1 Tax=Caerostris darwini TaxID=1538125 RepID=A0AAV4SKF7_9ARAC|nr:hypothetical protein CDAR_587481 [Caerostris darwini]